MAKAILEINKLILPVNIGHLEEERRLKQDIEFYIKIYMNLLPSSCYDDDIMGTVCYEQLTAEIKKFCEDKFFKLIEFLAYQLYQHLQNLIPESKIELKICKKPPIKEIKENCCFRLCEDFSKNGFL